MEIIGIDHVQIAIPAGSEEQARAFYAHVLGLEEIPKPEELARRGGLWFRCGAQQLHLGIEGDFRAAKKAHPALVVTNVAELAEVLRRAGLEPRAADDLPGVRRLFVADPFGNRLEFLERP